MTDEGTKVLSKKYESRLRIVRATRLASYHRNSLFMMLTHCDLYPPPKRL